MAKKKLTLGMAAAAAAGTAVYVAKKSQDKKNQQSTIVTAIQSAANMRKTARAFIIPMVIMKLLPDRKSRRVWRKNMPIS